MNIFVRFSLLQCEDNMKVTQGLLVLEFLGLTTKEENEAISFALIKPGSGHLQKTRRFLTGEEASERFEEYVINIGDEMALLAATKEDAHPIKLACDDLGKVQIGICPNVEEQICIIDHLLRAARLLWKDSNDYITPERHAAAAKALMKRAIKVLLDTEEPISRKAQERLKILREKWA